MLKLLAESKTSNGSLQSRKLIYAIYGFLMNPIKRDFLIIVKNKVICTDLFNKSMNSLFSDEEVAAKLAEADMIIADLDRANARIVALEHRNVSSVSFVMLPQL